MMADSSDVDLRAERLDEEPAATFVRTLDLGTPKVFVTMSAYAMGRELGIEGASAELKRQLDDASTEAIPGIRTILRLRHMISMDLRLDTGATSIGRTRSRAFHAAYHSGSDAWLSIDDDIEASTETLLYLLSAIGGIEPRVVLAPYYIRQARSEDPKVSVVFPKVIADRRIGARGRMRRCQWGGFGLVAMNRSAMYEVIEHNRETLDFIDADGVKRLGVFLEMITRDEDGTPRWVGEDIAFFKRLPRSVSVEAVLNGAVAHDGLALALDSLVGP